MEVQTREAVVQSAIDLAGFGRFNIKVALLCSLVYINAGFSMISIGFVIPAAACDFQMTTIDKGRISTAPILGTCIGCFIWGFLADVKGRKFALLCALLLQGTSEFIMSLVPYYWGFLALKLFGGIGMIGQLTLLFTYVGEFQPSMYQKKVLSLMDGALILVFLFVPLLAWVTIPLDFEFRTEHFFFRSWNLFVMLCSLIAELVAVWLMFFPETPKYLAEAGQNEYLIKVLVRIYMENTNDVAKTYIDKLAASNQPYLQQLASLYLKESVIENQESRGKKKLSASLKNFKKEAINIIKPSYFQRIVLACMAAFFITSAYYSFLLWFPEIFQRFAEFEAKYANESLSVCTVSNRLHSIDSTLANKSNSDPFSCDSVVDTTVYTHTLWQGLASIPSSVIMILFVDKVGFKFFLATTSATGGLTTLGLFFVKNSFQNLILACVFESAISACMSAMYCFVVVIFPTNLRIFASAITVFFSRVGSLVGNIIFSYLIDDYCMVLICIVAIQFFVGALLTFLVRGEEIPIHKV